VNDDELFTRFIYFGKTQLRYEVEEIWLMPFGHLLDMITCHKQFMGIEKPKRELSIDDIIPA
jgi:hypothetical protein